MVVVTASAQKENKTILLFNVNIVQVESGTLHKEKALLIEGDKIKAIGSFDQLSRGVAKSSLLDGRDKFLIPGLWDMHLHFEGAELVEDNKLLLPVFLAYGITTVRDCASDLGEQVLQWREEIKKGELVGPTIFTAGRKLEGKNSIWKGDLEIENEAELNAMLDLLYQYKVDFVKITENTLGGELFLQSVKASHARGYRVSGHVPYDLSIAELHRAGFTSVEHMGYLLRLGSDDEKIAADVRSGKITKTEAEQKYTLEFDQELALKKYKTLGAEGLFVCPTFIGGRQLAYLSETDHRQDQFLDFLSEKFVSNYQWRIERMGNENETQRQQRKDKYVFLKKQLPLIYNSGINVIAGSDAAALNTYVYPAESLIQELEIFEEAGLTPSQILKTATMNGASYFGMADKTGTIATGKIADLVLLDKNPLENISAVRSVNSIIAKGIYYDRAMLDAILMAAKEKKTALDSQRKK